MFTSIRLFQVVVVILFTIVASTVMAEEMATSEPVEQVDEGALLSADTPIYIPIQPGFEIFTAPFSSFTDNNKHWDAPSKLNITRDGFFRIDVKELYHRDNDGRHSWGNPHSPFVKAEYYDGPLNAQNTCDGKRIYAQYYYITSLLYKEKRKNVSYTGRDIGLITFVAKNQILCARFVRGWKYTGH